MPPAATATKPSARTSRSTRARARTTARARAGAAPRARARTIARAGAASRRTRTATPIPGRLVPVAVGRTAVAMGGIADSGLVVRLTRGRLWIGALAALLVGIVALNVVALSLNASSSKAATAADALRRENSALRAKLAEELSNARVQNAASMLGLIVPEPGGIGYLRLSDAQAAKAARRLRSGELTAAPTAVAPETPPIAEPLAPPVPPVAEPEGAPAPVEPEPATAAPAPAPEATAAAPTTTDGEGAGGGVASP